jgi:glycerol-3-phosphate dehydrogenase (NAD(P)+)
MKKIAILGAGSWGTALSIVFSRSKQPHEIALWVHSPALAEVMRERHENSTYLPGILLPHEVRVSSDLAQSLAGADIVIGAMPSAHSRGIYSQALRFFGNDTVFVSATKGLEPATHLRMSKVLAQVLLQASRDALADRIAVLSGPSFAAEAARGEPTAVVLAAADLNFAGQLQEDLAGPSFRLYTNDDVLGVELAGSMKNVIAIAAGACLGLGFGMNAQAALVTRGLAEMTRLAVAMGARGTTLSGLAGLGDLVLTCTGTLSRNKYVGEQLGRGKRLAEILAGMRMVAEGVDTVRPLLAVAAEHRIELPITEQVESMLYEGKSPREAVRNIMERPLKRE